MESEVFQKVLEKNKNRRPILKNSLKAFLFGGIVCLLGEVIRMILMKVFKVDSRVANTIMLFVFIFLSSIFTGLGIYDKLGQVAGAGAFIPITGFANSLTSSAIESKTEGIIQGTLTNMFKLAGAIIAIGAISSIFIGSIIYMVRCFYA
ncbi:MAG: SpoVA/SpoVAEb family sporulation membrane protein [Bacilli bacterium]|nr:SpoVA/SpoVAEb family sporulation membrane protein [Bacilli bacterium]